jgi:hypothetical protein
MTFFLGFAFGLLENEFWAVKVGKSRAEPNGRAPDINC